MGCTCASHGSPHSTSGRRTSLALVRVAGVEHDQSGDGLAAGRFGDEVGGRRREQREPAADLVGGVGHEVAVEAQQLGGGRARVQDHPRVDDRADRVQPELERGHDAEVAAAALEAPEQLGVLVGARAHDAAVGGHDLGGQEVLARRSERPLEPARAAAEGQPGDARVRHAPAGHGEPVRLGGGVELRPGQAGAEAAGTGRGIDLDVLHRAGVDHEAVVAAGVPGDRMAAAADGDDQVVLARVGQGELHVGRARAARDQRRPLVEDAVEPPARRVVVRMVGADQLSREPRVEARLRHYGHPGSSPEETRARTA